MRLHRVLLLVGSASIAAACGATTDRDGETTARTPTPTTSADTTAAPTIEYSRSVRIQYGDGPQQFADLSLPGPEVAPLAVLIHGGFWRNPYDLTLMEPLADDLVEHGYAVWNLEYRRLGDEGGGWPGTLDDVAAGIDALADVAAGHPIDVTRTAFVGHSAGGHLALWAAGRAGLPSEAPGASPAVVPVVAIGQGAVVDLAGGAAAGLGNGAVSELLDGSPSDHPDRYDWATPRLDAGSEMVSVVGSDDDIVPPRFSVDPQDPSAVELIQIEGADHFDLIDPTHTAWQAVVDALHTQFTDNRS